MSGGLLLADIGGTHARFALAGDRFVEVEKHVLVTERYTDAAQCIADGLANLNGVQPEFACIAVAGPVIDGSASVTKGASTKSALNFSEAALTSQLGCPVRLINDFEAMSYGALAAKRLVQVGGEPEVRFGTRVCLGPGTGLGVGALIRDGDRWLSIASEAAQAGIAPSNPLEQELLGILQSRFDHVCWETVLSGPGLRYLYEAVCMLWGGEPESLTPEQITAQAISVEDPVCHQTLEIFCGLLGSVAGTMALTFCADGGVYVAGGMVPALRDFIASSPLRRRFEEQGELSDFVARIPIRLVLDEDPGLVGAHTLAVAMRANGMRNVAEGGLSSGGR